ncbi:MAG TPA: hypothetical protein VF666_12490 [Pyrinomonadaceae bacterium]|jgi:hypothetical protein
MMKNLEPEASKRILTEAFRATADGDFSVREWGDSWLGGVC